MAFLELPADRAYRLLEAGPVVLVTTVDADGRPNVMTMGFHMVIEHSRALIGAVIDPGDHSHGLLRRRRECVLAVPTVDMATTMVDIGNCSGRDVDKFSRFGLTALPASRVAAPLIGECLANIECTVVDDSLAERYAGLFILRAVAIHVDADRAERRTLHHNGDGTFTVDGDLLDLRDRMVLWTRYQD